MNRPELKQIIFLLGICFLCRQANAIPMLDGTKLAPVITQGTAAVEKLKEVKEVVSELEKTKAAIGDKISGLVEFATSLTDKLNLSTFPGHVATTVNENLQSIDVAQSSISETLETAQKQKINLAVSIIAKTEEAIANTADNPTQVKEDLAADFEDVEKTGIQLAVAVNDIFDATLSSLNQNAAKSHEVLKELDKRIDSDKELSDVEKEKLLAQNLTGIEQETTDTGISVIEKAKVQYNKEYKEHFSDELNNYHRVVMAYAEGKADRTEVINAGEQFKVAVANIDSELNRSAVDSYKKQTEILQSGIDKMAQSINTYTNKESNHRQI